METQKREGQLNNTDECIFSPLHGKIAKVCCDRLLLAHSTNFITLNFVVVSHEIFLVRVFAAFESPSVLCPGTTAPSAPLPLSYSTVALVPPMSTMYVWRGLT